VLVLVHRDISEIVQIKWFRNPTRLW